MRRGDLNLPSLFVEKAVAINEHSTMVKKTAADNIDDSRKEPLHMKYYEVL